MHGFHPEDDPYSSAAFLANRSPGRPVRNLIDVNAVMLDWIEALEGVARAKN